jgi:hypothetical protein
MPDAAAHPPRPRSPRQHLATVIARAFPLVLLLFTTFFLLGRIGFWSDDYWHNLRDPITQQLPPLFEDGRFNLVVNRGFFLRPLFYTVVPPITTLAWHADWAAHLVLVLTHAAAVLLLWQLMLRLGLARRAATAAALLFMTYPMLFENMFWLSALPTTLAAIIMLLMFHMHISIARGPRSAASWAAIAAMPALSFAVCSLNEQPAAGVLAMPFVYLAAAVSAPLRQARTGAQGLVTRPLAHHIVPCLLPPLLAGLAVILYIYLMHYGWPPHVQPAPPGVRGTTDTLMERSEIPQRIGRFTRSIRKALWVRDLGAGSFILGLQELRAAPAAAILWGAALLTTGWFWARHWIREQSAALHPPATSATRLALLLGAAIFIFGFIPPMVVTIYLAVPRLMYWPGMGLAIIIAALGTMLGACALAQPARAAARRMRITATILLIVILFAWSICGVGFQASFRNRWLQDHAEGAQLRALVPDPAPLTFFIPAHAESRSAQTGRRGFDSHLLPVWHFPWATRKHIMGVYQREDVRCGSCKPWEHFIRASDETGIHYRHRIGPEFPHIEGGGARIPWERAVPFIITPDGQMQLITTIIIEEDGRPDIRIEVPQARPRPTSPDRPGIEPLEYRVPRG